MMESSKNSVNQDLKVEASHVQLEPKTQKVEADQDQLGTEAGENAWKMPKGFRYVEMSNSHQIRALLHRYRPTPPYYKPPSPSYSLTSSVSRRKSRSYRRTSRSTSSEDYNPTSLPKISTPPSYRPTSAAYSLASTEYQHVPVIVNFYPPTEPGYRPTSHAYNPSSPVYSPTSPGYIPISPGNTSYIPTSASNSSSGMGPSSTQKRS